MKAKEESEKVDLKLNIQQTDHGIWSHPFMANSWRNSRNNGWLYFWGAPKSLQTVIAAMKLRDTSPWNESYDQPRQHIEKQRHYFDNKCLSSQGYGFSSGHVWI